MTDEGGGGKDRPLPPWAPSSVSLAADSFPLGGGSHYGAPARAQRRGSRGERRSSGMSELSPLGGSERYGACDDEGASHVAARGRTLCAPTDSAYPVWRGLLDAPYLPPGGKVAFAEQMTDEGATCLPPCRGAPMCAPRTGGRTRRSAPTDNAPSAWGTPCPCAGRRRTPLRMIPTMWGAPPGRAESEIFGGFARCRM